jgi:hypothetical protein
MLAVLIPQVFQEVQDGAALRRAKLVPATYKTVYSIIQAVQMILEMGVLTCSRRSVRMSPEWRIYWRHGPAARAALRPGRGGLLAGSAFLE